MRGLNQVPERLHVITDPGIDDAMALFYAFGLRQYVTKLVTCSYGNNCLKQTYKNARFLFSLMPDNTKDVVLRKGARKPIAKKYSPFYEIHGQNGLGEYDRESSSPEWLKKNPFKSGDQLEPDIDTIVSLAPLTELAHQVSSKDWRRERVDRILIMGGSFYYPGNAGNYREGNFYYDPQAALDVISKIADEIVLFPLNLTQSVLVNEDLLDEINCSDNECSRFIKTSLRFYIESYLQKKEHYYPPDTSFSQIDGNRYKGACLHDVFPFHFLQEPENFNIKTLSVNIITDGEAQGAVYIDPHSGYNVKVALSLKDKGRFLKSFVEAINLY